MPKNSSNNYFWILLWKTPQKACPSFALPSVHGNRLWHKACPSVMPRALESCTGVDLHTSCIYPPTATYILNGQLMKQACLSFNCLHVLCPSYNLISRMNFASEFIHLGWGRFRFCKTWSHLMPPRVKQRSHKQSRWWGNVPSGHSEFMATLCGFQGNRHSRHKFIES